MKKAFDNKKYIRLQKDKILDRVNQFDNKLYIEFGGKLFDDYHASRVLPGFEIDSKLKVLTTLKKQIEVIISISAEDIQTGKMRNDNGLAYEDEVLNLVDKFENYGLVVGGIVITMYNQQPLAKIFYQKLKNLSLNVYLHYPISGYPHQTDFILSEEGFGKNEYIETTHPIVIVTGPGPGSGKMATCLSQLYHDNLKGIRSGYAKYETFPIWNLSLKHPVNLAYEAATADLKDVNMIDYFHLDAYGKSTVNYNRDLEVFPVLNKMFEKIYGSSPYLSPTDMGVNMVGFAISDEEEAIKSSKQEIIRRYLDACRLNKMGKFTIDAVEKIERIMNELSITTDDRRVVRAALDYTQKVNCPVVAIEVGKHIVYGKKTELFTASAAAVINALKYLAKLPKEMPLLSYSLIEPIQNLKKEQLKKRTQRLHLNDVLIALAITATTNEMAKAALSQLPKLARAQLHSNVMIDTDDIEIIHKLKIDATMGTYQDTKLLKEF
ncbi:MAG: DUF1846 domain-containing protein [Bacilli bacterium]|nr:DUF1846 domain-containing protein [Bacilli bacterium]